MSSFFDKLDIIGNEIGTFNGMPTVGKGKVLKMIEAYAKAYADYHVKWYRCNEAKDGTHRDSVELALVRMREMEQEMEKVLRKHCTDLAHAVHDYARTNPNDNIVEE